MLSVTAWAVGQKLESQAREEIGNYLTNQLDTTHHAVMAWFQEHKASAQIWASTPEIRRLTTKLLATPHTRKNLIASPAQAELRHWYEPLRTIKAYRGYQGYFVIGPDNINLASSRDQNIGVESLLSGTQFIQKVWAGETVLSLPLISDVPLPDREGNLRAGLPTMFVGTPIKGPSGKVIAIFTFRINPLADFTTIFLQGRLGMTGETYAFDNRGRLISDSRFDDQLHDIGLLSAGESAILNIEVRDPGINLLKGKKNNLPKGQQPLTLMAARAIGAGSGMELHGYNNYRGVPVIGAWLWDSELGFGIATELDIDEAYQTLRATRYTIASLSLLLILASIGITIIYINSRARKRAQQALEESEARFKAQFKAIPTPIYTWRNEGDDFVLIDYNKAADDITCGGIKDVIGKTLCELYADSPNSEVTEDVRRCFSTQTIIRKDMGYQFVTTGEKKYLDVVYVPTPPDLVIVYTYDLTERRHAEKALQRSEALERLAKGASLNEILTALVFNAEKHNPETLCSVMLLDKDGQHLRHGAAPSLPDFYNKAIDGVELGHELGTCVAAAYSGERVIVEDIMDHPMWINYQKLASKAGLRACWSEPVISSTGDILGTFAIYDHKPRVPTQSDLDFIQDSARLAAIAIEHKRAEEELRKSEERYRSVIQQQIEMVCRFKPDFTLTFVNNAYCRYFGKSEHELLGKSFFTLIPEEAWDSVRQHFASFTPDKPVQVQQHQVISPDGSIRWQQWTNQAFFDTSGKLLEFQAMGVDITEHKWAQDELVRFKATLDQTRDCVFMFRPDSLNFFYVNRGAVEQMGYRLDELLKMGPTDIKPDYDEERFRELISPLIGGDKKELAFETRHQRKDGYIIPVEIRLQYVELAGAEPWFVAIVRDISERKHAEQSMQKLLQQNRDLTQRLFHVQEEERRHLARELHDEFSQWLTAIHLNAETISQLSKKQNPHIHDSAKIIDESASEMYNNIHGMIHQLRPMLLDELGLVESIKYLVEQWQARHSEVDITLSLDGELDGFEDDLNITLYRVIQESLTNVSKYAEARDVAVELSRQSGEVGTEDSVLLTIEDNGKGMDTEAATEGFGLAGMRERVLAVGGKFNIHSFPGKGTRIKISIPVN